MAEQKQMLEVVDENDRVTGIETRERIHQKGLLHREIHVWFMIPDGGIVFQHRARDKDTFPDLLDATVGGHVEPGMSYEETALKEGEEETGIVLDPSKLKFIKKMRRETYDNKTNKRNNTFRASYAYLFEGNISDLKMEEGKSLGFEVWPFDSLQNLSVEDKQKFIPSLISAEFLQIYKEGQILLGLYRGNQHGQ